MHSLRHGLAQRLIVLLLAAVMPLCCCVVKGMAATPDSSVLTAVSCCCDSTRSCETDQQSPEQDSCGSCCCVKAPSHGNDWTPPTDEIGLELPPLAATIALQCKSLDHGLAPHVHMHTNPTPPGPWGCAAPPLRHMTILQV
ncbi:MAG: hypothetical protein HOJ54_01455 [Phycisphaerae bacterium]|nr:hypothetical protein [Phycisphaerae bacterium]